MAVNYYKDKSQDTITLAELDLYHTIMEYRRDNGLPAVQLSKGLTITAGRHLLDIVENFATYPASGHTWSDAPYSSTDAATWPNMWNAPKRLGTSYQSDVGFDFNGYEIATGYSGTGHRTMTMTPDEAFSNWRGSGPHNEVMINGGSWTVPWLAIGVGLYKGVAQVWFGQAKDPGGVPKIVGTGGNDRIDGTKFKDVVSAKAGNDAVKGGNGDDRLLGDDGNDDLDGGNGKDRLEGGTGNDVLKGGAGKDVLAGNQGADTLAGGKQADRFEFRKTGDSTLDAAGQDFIKDFKRGQKDRIDLKRIDADTTDGGNQAFTFIGKAKFGGEAGELRAVKKGGDTFVYGDVNGDGAADFAIRLDTAIDLVKADFVL